MLGAASLVLLLQSEAGRGYGRPDVVMAVSDRLGSRKHEYHVAEGCDCRYTVQPFLRSRESFDGVDVVLLPLYHDDSLANFSLHLAPHQLLIHDYNIAAQFNFTASWALPSDTNVMASFGPIPFRNPRIERVLESWDDLEHLPPLKEKNAPFDAAYLASHMVHLKA
ncbi:hypothetical protein Pelo_19351 [Pelomyxa schiedti]|nr:hypothetical protein Pelo_19351 [Pelomyxa schiedti]